MNLKGISELRYYDPKKAYSVNFAQIGKVDDRFKDLFMIYSPDGKPGEKNRIKWMSFNHTLFNFVLQKK